MLNAISRRRSRRSLTAFLQPPLSRLLPALLIVGNLACAPTAAHAPVTATGARSAAVTAAKATSPAAAQAPSAGASMASRCVTPDLHEQQRASRAMADHLRAEGHRDAEVVRVVLIDDDDAVARVRSGDPAVPRIWHLDSVMHPNPAAPDRWSPKPGTDEDARLLSAAEVIAAGAPDGTRLFKLRRGRNKPDRVVVQPWLSDARGTIRNTYQLPFVRLDPAVRQAAHAAQQAVTNGAEASPRTAGWTLREPLADTLKRSSLAEQRALARHLNGRGMALRRAGGLALRDPRGRLHPVSPHRCKAKAHEPDGTEPNGEERDDGQADRAGEEAIFVLVTNPQAAPERWQMRPVAMTPRQHHERTISAQQQALAKHLSALGIDVELHDREQQQLYYLDRNRTLKSGTYRFTLRQDAPLLAGSWKVALDTSAVATERLTLYRAMRDHFGGAKVVRWRSAHKAQRLIVLERCLPAKPGCQKQFATTVSLHVKIREGANRYKQGVVKLTRPAASDPFAAASWTVTSSSLERVEPMAP